MRIFITRHGQVCPKKFEGSADYPTGDIPLTEKGEEQGRKLGKALEAYGFCGKIFASPYRRTMMTASRAAEVWAAPIYPKGALREMFFSDAAGEAFCGMTLAELKKEFPLVAEDATLSFPWWTTHTDTLEGLGKRLESFWESLLQEEDGDVLLIGHGASVFGSMHYINRRFSLGMPTELTALGDYLATRNLNCNLSCVEIADGELVRATLFDTDHLEAEYLTSNPAERERPEKLQFS